MTGVVEGGPAVFAGVTETDAAQWAAHAAVSALLVPAQGTASQMWIARGLAEVALGCALLRSQAAYAELDRVVAEVDLSVAGPVIRRLRALRCLGGPVPWSYPVGGEAGEEPVLTRPARRAGELLAVFCDQVDAVLAGAGGRFRRASPLPARSARRQLAEGARFRPSAADPESVLVVDPELPAGALWRSWLRLPTRHGPATVLVERRSSAPAVTDFVWRAIHDGAHVDHLQELRDLNSGAPSPAEFGCGLAVAEGYAMAVELLACVDSLLDGEHELAARLRAGVVERLARMCGSRSWARSRACASATMQEVMDLPLGAREMPGVLAESYLIGALELLGGRDPGPLLPARLRRELLDRWQAACRSFEPAAELTAGTALR